MHPCKRTSVYRLLSRPDTSDNFLPTYNFSVAGGAQDCGNGRLDHVKWRRSLGPTYARAAVHAVLGKPRRPTLVAPSFYAAAQMTHVMATPIRLIRRKGKCYWPSTAEAVR